MNEIEKMIWAAAFIEALARQNYTEDSGVVGAKLAALAVQEYWSTLGKADRKEIGPPEARELCLATTESDPGALIRAFEELGKVDQPPEEG